MNVAPVIFLQCLVNSTKLLSKVCGFSISAQARIYIYIYIAIVLRLRGGQNFRVAIVTDKRTQLTIAITGIATILRVE